MLGCPPSPSWAWPTRRCARRASACTPPCSTRASSSPSGGSPRTWRPPTCARWAPASTWRSRSGCSRPAGRWRPRLSSAGPSSASCRSAVSCAPRAGRSAWRRARAGSGSRASSFRASAPPRPRWSRACGSPGWRPCARSPRCSRASGRLRCRRPRRRADDAAREPDVDLGDVRGHAEPVEALVIAAAGGHHLLMEGPPGTGKTMLARRLPGILPPLDRTEAIEVTRIRSVAGLHAGSALAAAPALPRAAPQHLGLRAGRRRRRARAGRGDPRPPRRAVPRRALRVRAAGPGGAAPAARGRARDRRARPAREPVPDALHAGRGDEPLRRAASSAKPGGAAARSPTSRATAAA